MIKPDHIKLRVETRDGRKEVDVELTSPPGYEIALYELAGKELTPEMKSFRDSWLASKAIAPLPKLVKYCGVCKREHKFEFENCPYDGTALTVTPTDSTSRPAGRGGRGGRGGE